MDSTFVIRSFCPDCGDVRVPAAMLRCALDPVTNLGLTEFVCPGCGLLRYRAVSRPGYLRLQACGVSRAVGAMPLEFLERHVGEPISESEITELREGLRRCAYPQLPS